MINKEFSKTDTVFIKACKLAEIKPTVRQASKFRMAKGRAYAFKAKAINLIKEEESGEQGNTQS